MGLFNDRKKINDKTITPVWFMRQAGRYHSHYQNIKKDSDFMTMCKNSDLACEITMGPIEDFHFDAAILFSDLLFPLEQLNLGLSYKSGPPTLEVRLNSIDDIKKLQKIEDAKTFYSFQAEALTKLKHRLPNDKTLLGFVGAPFTLYSYACEGSHSGNLTQSKLGLYDGRYDNFVDILLPELITNMEVQAEGGADAMCLFDTAAGELTPDAYKDKIIPTLKKVTKAFKQKFPNKKLIYYSKFTHESHLKHLEDDNIDVLGVDWRHDLTKVLKTFTNDYMIQGNFDPSYLHLPWEVLEHRLKEFKDSVLRSEVNLDRWICGLGHGVLQHTPESNVRDTVKWIHENFIY